MNVTRSEERKGGRQAGGLQAGGWWGGGWWGGARALGLPLAASLWGLLLLCVPFGCAEMAPPDMDDIIEPSKLKYEEVGLLGSALEERMQEVDTQFKEPRFPEKVEASYAASMHSISKVNGYAALWRGARACAWLSANHPERSRRLEFGLKGMALGREAVKKASTQAESFYYLALCLGNYAKAKRSTSNDHVKEMRDAIKMSMVLDEKLDYCGAHRFLGMLMVETDPYPLYAVGSLEQGLELLKEATVLCSEYGENHLLYAQALKKDGQFDVARAELEKVIESMRPTDHSAEHQSWLEEANALLTDLQGRS